MTRRPRSHIRRNVKRTVYDRDGGLCFWCNISMSLEESTVDHIITAGRGGKHKPPNLVLSCFDCNQRRGDMKADYFLKLTFEKEGSNEHPISNITGAIPKGRTQGQTRKMGGNGTEGQGER